MWDKMEIRGIKMAKSIRVVRNIKIVRIVKAFAPSGLGCLRYGGRCLLVRKSEYSQILITVSRARLVQSVCGDQTQV